MKYKGWGRHFRFDPLQRLSNLPDRDLTNDRQAVKLNRSLAPVTRLNVDMGKQVVTGVHHRARCREFVQDRHGCMIVQQLHHIKTTLIRPGDAQSFGGGIVVQKG